MSEFHEIEARFAMRMSEFFGTLHRDMAWIKSTLLQILQKEDIVSDTLTDVQTAISALSTEFSTFTSDLTSIVSDLATKQAAQEDTTPIVSQLQQFTTGLVDLDTKLKSLATSAVGSVSTISPSDAGTVDPNANTSQAAIGTPQTKIPASNPIDTVTPGQAIDNGTAGTTASSPVTPIDAGASSTTDNASTIVSGSNNSGTAQTP